MNRTTATNYNAKWLLAHADYGALRYTTWGYSLGIQVPSYIIMFGHLPYKHRGNFTDIDELKQRQYQGIAKLLY